MDILGEVTMETVPYNSYFYAPDVDPLFPTSVTMPLEKAVQVGDGDTAFGFVYCGEACIEKATIKQALQAGMFFSTPGPAAILGLQGFVCHRKSYRGLPLWGGPVEKLGRLKYIDGCSDTLLLAAPVKGDPCLNYLYIPPGVNQTAHTHPSVRVGCIIDGGGYCRLANKTIDLIPGEVFVLPADELHSFHTSDQPLRIIVYHPDSDFGPTDEVHPMVNRTIVDNKPVAGDNKYRTLTISEFVE
jgi:quercetin dioxygenase-like cupin family protein